MWEFSIVVSSENASVAKFIYRSLFEVVAELKGIISSFEHKNKISILVAVPKIEKSRIEFHIISTLANVVCTFFKEKFLSKRLQLPARPNIELFAFKKALIFFDRETDRFLVTKFLKLNRSIQLESFFHFRLGALKEKWAELASIANDNLACLLGDDSFLELIRFLVDNIDAGLEEVKVKIVGQDIRLYDAKGQEIQQDQIMSRQQLVDFLLTKSPRRIVWQADGKDNFLEKIFASRIVYQNLAIK